MKKLILLLLFIPLVSFGQNREAMKLCVSIGNSINSFVSESEADDALHKIISVIGASTNFILQSCNDINNAIAVTYKGNRYILYDKNFMQQLNYKSNNWSSMFILAHEIGHHINGHTRELTISNQLDPQSLSKQREEELEADEFAGFVLSSLGASYDEAVRGISLLASDRDDRYSTHPNKSKRLEAIRLGFNKSNKVSKNTPNSSYEIINYSIGRWEGPVKKTVSKRNVITEYDTIAEETTTSSVPYGKGIFIFNDGTIYKGFWYDGLLKRKTNTSKKSSSTNLKNANNIKAGDYFDRGLKKSDLKDYYGAIVDYTKAIELNPDYADAYNNRGNAKYNLKDFNAAIDDYNKAIELNPDFQLAYFNRGLSKDNLKDYYGAIVDYTKAIELDPDSADAYRWRGRAKDNLKDYSGAIVDYTKAIELDPDSADAYYQRGKAKDKLKDLNGAIDDYTKAIELDPKDYVYSRRGGASAKIKDYTRAISDLTKAIKLDPDYPLYYSNRAWYKILNNDFYSAIDDCNKAIQLDPNYGSAYNNRGNAKNKLGDLNGACSDWKIASKMGNKYAQDSLKKFCN